MELLLNSLDNYYNHSKNFQKFKNVIESNEISLRIIDWFVTNYSKKYNIFYQIYKTDTGKLTFSSEGNKFYKEINIYHSYKTQLKSFNKKKFDPFCRKERIIFKEIETTVGQLNFFRWIIDNLIVDYIKKNYKLIEEDMNQYSTNIKKKDFEKRKKRQELSKSISRGLNYNQRKIVLNFS